MLGWLLSQHPQVTITHEHRSFLQLGAPRAAYLSELRADDHIARPLVPLRRGNRLLGPFISWWYAQRFNSLVRRAASPEVTIEELAAHYARLFPNRLLVGDKFPRYVFKLERLLSHRSLIGLVIYRDPRDVVVSTLRQTAGAWRDKPFRQRLDTPAKIAAKWVEAVKMLEANQQRLLSVRYEELVTRPEAVLRQLASELGLEPLWGRINGVRTASIGRYRDELTLEQIEEVESIAGQMMQRLGYRQLTAA